MSQSRSVLASLACILILSGCGDTMQSALLSLHGVVGVEIYLIEQRVRALLEETTDTRCYNDGLPQ